PPPLPVPPDAHRAAQRAAGSPGAHRPEAPDADPGRRTGRAVPGPGGDPAGAARAVRPPPARRGRAAAGPVRRGDPRGAAAGLGPPSRPRPPSPPARPVPATGRGERPGPLPGRPGRRWMGGSGGTREEVRRDVAGGWTVRVRVFDTSGGRERVRDCGTGVVLPGAQILTSAHVLAGAAARGARVVVDAPGALRERAWTAEVDVAEVFDEGPADFAVLRLPDAPPPPLHPPELRRCGDPAGREVAVSGYPGGGETELWAYCALRDRGGRPGGVQMEGQRTTAQRIVPGYSGAGVRDERTGAVVG